MVVVLLAEGFEEIEALAVVDILRRGGVEVKMVSIETEKWVCGAHGIRVEADIAAGDGLLPETEAVILPGGGLGTENLKQSAWWKKHCVKRRKKGFIYALFARRLP